MVYPKKTVRIDKLKTSRISTNKKVTWPVAKRLELLGITYNLVGKIRRSNFFSGSEKKQTFVHLITWHICTGLAENSLRCRSFELVESWDLDECKRPTKSWGKRKRRRLLVPGDYNCRVAMVNKLQVCDLILGFCKWTCRDPKVKGCKGDRSPEACG